MSPCRSSDNADSEALDDIGLRYGALQHVADCVDYLFDCADRYGSRGGRIGHDWRDIRIVDTGRRTKELDRKRLRNVVLFVA